MALYLQNVPQFVIGLVATWKAGGVAVPVNPMYRARELDAVLRDSGARVLVCLQSLYRDVAAGVVNSQAYRQWCRLGPERRRARRRAACDPAAPGSQARSFRECHKAAYFPNI